MKWLCSFLLLLSPLAHAEAFITFDPLVSGPRAYYATALTVDDTVMFSNIVGSVFYKENGLSYVEPAWGACQQRTKGIYNCTFTSGADTFRLYITKASGKGTIGLEGATIGNIATLVEVQPRLVPTGGK